MPEANLQSRDRQRPARRRRSCCRPARPSPGPITLPDKGGVAPSGSTSVSSAACEPARVPETACRRPTRRTCRTSSGPASRWSAVQTAAGAHHYRFVGIELLPDRRRRSPRRSSGWEARRDDRRTDCRTTSSSTAATSTATRPLEGDAASPLNSASSAVIDSYLADWKEVGADSQAIVGLEHAGPDQDRQQLPRRRRARTSCSEARIPRSPTWCPRISRSAAIASRSPSPGVQLTMDGEESVRAEERAQGPDRGQHLRVRPGQRRRTTRSTSSHDRTRSGTAPVDDDRGLNVPAQRRSPWTQRGFTVLRALNCDGGRRTRRDRRPIPGPEQSLRRHQLRPNGAAPGRSSRLAGIYAGCRDKPQHGRSTTARSSYAEATTEQASNDRLRVHRQHRSTMAPMAGFKGSGTGDGSSARWTRIFPEYRLHEERRRGRQRRFAISHGQLLPRLPTTAVRFVDLAGRRLPARRRRARTAMPRTTAATWARIIAAPSTRLRRAPSADSAGLRFVATRPSVNRLLPSSTRRASSRVRSSLPTSSRSPGPIPRRAGNDLDLRRRRVFDRLQRAVDHHDVDDPRRRDPVRALPRASNGHRTTVSTTIYGRRRVRDLPRDDGRAGLESRCRTTRACGGSPPNRAGESTSRTRAT